YVVGVVMSGLVLPAVGMKPMWTQPGATVFVLDHLAFGVPLALWALRFAPGRQRAFAAPARRPEQGAGQRASCPHATAPVHGPSLGALRPISHAPGRASLSRERRRGLDA